MDRIVRNADRNAELHVRFQGGWLQAHWHREIGHGETQIAEGVVNGDDISFVENLDYQGQALRIVYKGKISGDEIKFTRNVADMVTEDLVAKRSK